MTPRNPLGLADTVEGWWDLARRVRARRGRSVESLLAQGAWEERVSRQYGRWPWGSPHGAEPARRVPADVLVLRTLAAGSDLGLGLPDPADAPGYRGGLAAAALDGVPHWLPSRTAEGIAHSEPPPAEMLADLRLPWGESAVWFGAPAQLGRADGLLPEAVRAAVRDARSPDGRVRLDDVPWELAVGAAALVSADPEDAPAGLVDVAVDGAVLLADDEGRPSDLMVWALAATPPASAVRSRPIRLLAPALRSRSDLADAVDNLLAVVAWGDWCTPEARGVPEPGVDRRELRKWLRGNDPSVLGPVRVLDVPDRSHGRRSSDLLATSHASPVTHLRRGHWRNQYRRSTDDHQPVWIAPVVVNPGGVDDAQVVVWRLPGR